MRCLFTGLLVVSAALAAPGDEGGLISAARNDDAAAVQTLLKQGSNPNLREADGSTALAWAVIRSNAELAASLLKAGADPNLTNELGIGPLALAVTGGSAELVRLLLDHKADPNAARENGETPLMTAAQMGRSDVVKLLLDRGASANVRDKKFGQTALMRATGSPESVKLLLEHGADVQAVTRTWDIKYTIYLPTTVTLGKTGIPWNNEGDYTTKKGGLNALFFAVQNNDLASVKMLLDAGIDVNSKSADGTTPLLAALYKWDPPKTTFVPGKGAPAAAGSSQRFGANVQIAQLLLDRGATVHAVDGSGYTPLHGAALAVAQAARTGNRQKAAYGQTAAALALGPSDDTEQRNSLTDSLALVRRLLDAGADPNKQTVYPTGGPAGDVRINPAPSGSSPMHMAASSGSVELARILTDHGGNPNLIRKDGHTPFSVAVLAGDLPIVKELAERGADFRATVNPQDKIPDPVEAITLARQKQTMMHLAAIEGKPELLEYLFSLGVPLTAKNSMDETPLDLADKQERYREAIQRQGADGDPEKLKNIVRKTAGSDTLRKLASQTAAR